MSSESFFVFLAGIGGTLGFSVFFGVKPKRLPWAVLGGTIVCAVYVLTKQYGVFVSCTLASLFATFYCELIARIQRAPVVTFLSPAIIILVPGGGLYYTISSMLAKRYDEAGRYCLEVVDACLGIAAGIMVASLLVTVFLHTKQNICERVEAHGKKNG